MNISGADGYKPIEIMANDSTKPTKKSPNIGKDDLYIILYGVTITMPDTNEIKTYTRT